MYYSDDEKLHSLPDSPKDAECQSCAERMQLEGRLIAAEALESVQTATTVRVRNGKLSVTDGPFAETKEQLAGFSPDPRQRSERGDPGSVKNPAGARVPIEVRPIRQLKP